MKTTSFSVLTILCLMTLFFSSDITFAQDFPQLLNTVTGTLEHPHFVESVVFSPDGSILASGCGDNKVRLWDVATHTLEDTLEEHTGPVMSVAFSPDGTTLASASLDNTVRLWDVRTDPTTGTTTGTLNHTIAGDTGSFFRSVAFSPDGITLASASSGSTAEKNKVDLWNAVTGSRINTFVGHTGWIVSVAFSPDGTTLASGSWDNTVRLWDVATGTLTNTLEGHRENVFSVAFSPDSTILASGSGDNKVRLWDAATGTLRNTLEEHTSSVWCVAFSPDGTTLASGGVIMVYLWDAATGTLRNTLEEHTGWINSVAFSPDGTMLASGSRDRTVLLWQLTPVSPPPSPPITFPPSAIADQTFTTGTPVNVTLPSATDGTPPYTYTLSPIPDGLAFDTTTRELNGTPTTPGTTEVTYTATDTTGASASLTFTITVQDTPSLTDVYMYWVDIGVYKIQRATLDGANVQDLVTGLSRPVSIAVDIAGGKMYWTDRDSRDTSDPAGKNSIQRANLDGTNVETLILGGNSIKEYIVLDIFGGKMYWTDWSQFDVGKIQRANLDGSNVEDLVTGLGTGLRGIALDISGGKIYWADSAREVLGGTTIGQISRANLDGSNIEDLLSIESVHGIALDIAGGKIYWANPGPDKIQRANLDGSNLEDIVVDLNQPFGIALDSLSGKVYWADNLAGKIQRANLDGTNVEDLVTGLRHPIGITLGIPQIPGLRFNPNVIADQTFTMGTPVNLTLPIATGGTSPYTYSTSALPPGLHFDPVDRWLNGTPTTPGTTEVTYTATDATGASASLTFTITVTEDGGLNLDVNGDGQITVVDLAIVALFYGTQVPVGVSLPADVNTDGVVNLLDLTAVAQGIDAASGGLNQVSLWEVEAALLAAVELKAIAGAPMGFDTPQRVLFGGVAYSNVAAALTDARSLTDGDVRLGKWAPVLEGILQLLAELGAIPESTALLPNYPNPFNPETWLPYQLANAADVTLTIYDMRGVSVRELVLGHQPAGVYRSRGRAAYWDGKNNHGEPVASGVYFYTLTAGDFTATRKLMIRK